MNNSKLRTGFTLIEILVVIAIIGILAALIFSNFVGVRQRARDSQRKSDLKQMQIALDLYRSDVGSYPTPRGTGFAVSLNSSDCPASSPLISGAVTYMQKIPCNPNPPSTTTNYAQSDGDYYYTSDGVTYELNACIENINDKDPNVISIGVYCPSGKAYRLINP